MKRFAPLFTKFIPKLEKVEGTLDAQAKISGKLGKPEYVVDLKASLPFLHLDVGQLENLKNVNITGSLDNDHQLKGKMSAEINGGGLSSVFTADLTELSQPTFNVQVQASHALLYRDDKLVLRVNGDLALKGTIDDATISGKAEIVESLFYREIELIPFGVPSAAVDPVKLPKFTRVNSLDIPAPFDKWKLDLDLRIKDPLLIRGNLGQGRVEGGLKAKGTMQEPELDGTLYLRKLEIELPFSKLAVDNGKVIFSPQNGFIPRLDIKGQSRVSKYDTNIYIYGLATNPKTTFNSYPPLPETEIMTLIASGVTTNKLENQQVMASRAFRLLLLEASKMSRKPNGNDLFTKMLENFDKFEMEIGETDDFTGRTFSSASLRLHERWNLTAQWDEDNQTRQLIVYSLRFK